MSILIHGMLEIHHEEGPERINVRTESFRIQYEVLQFKKIHQQWSTDKRFSKGLSLGVGQWVVSVRGGRRGHGWGSVGGECEEW